MSRHPLRSAAAACFALLLAVLGGIPSAAAASPPAAPELPSPTGKQLIGTKSLHLVDTGRTDPWKPEAGHRQLMASLWYPALRSSARPAPYASAALSTAIFGTDALAAIRTHATVNAPAAPGARPLVVLSPGFGMSRLTLTTLAEELAGRGYVVAALDHTYETPVEFPGGRIEPCLICERPDFGRVVPNRVKDIGFLLDRLTRPGTGVRVDATRIAVAGHSIGGASAVELLGTDSRVDAAVNLDGDFFTAPPARALKRPVLLFGAQRTRDSVPNANWNERRRHFSGWQRWLDVPTGGHMTFTDVPWIGSRFDLGDRIPADQRDMAFGTLPGDRATPVVRAYVAAFMDRHLRGRPSPLLDRPSAAYPEVRFVK
ncbi:alpha/beta hydrolase family protein [Streptomyces syringium]|uniref:alpha/beta hydrolase family protein n=1 Tax=Streptomyces syringium TaxID=76729 RepID=UPI00368D28D1